MSVEEQRSSRENPCALQRGNVGETPDNASPITYVDNPHGGKAGRRLTRPADLQTTNAATPIVQTKEKKIDL